MRSILVVTEIAAACMLLVASGLLVRSFVRVLDLDLGFRPGHTEALPLRMDPEPRPPTLQAASAHYDDLLRRVRAIPGVEQAAITDVLPFAGDRSWGVSGQGQVYERDRYPEAFIRVVSDGYFRTMGIAMRAGRDFAEGDAPDAPGVAIVNETLARMLWPGRDAVGQYISADQKPRRVVGVVADVRHGSLEQGFTGELYLPIRQTSDHSAEKLVVHTSLSQGQLAASVREALGAEGAQLSRNQWVTLQQLIDHAASPRRFVVLLLGGFTAFALVLAALGIYALVSYGVSQRTQEIGIRLALGASEADVRAQILRGTAMLAGAGVLAGVAGSVLVVPSLAGMLFGVTWRDPASFAAAFVLLAAVALAAGYFPARRAARVEPSVSLRAG